MYRGISVCQLGIKWSHPSTPLIRGCKPCLVVGRQGHLLPLLNNDIVVVAYKRRRNSLYEPTQPVAAVLVRRDFAAGVWAAIQLTLIAPESTSENLHHIQVLSLPRFLKAMTMRHLYAEDAPCVMPKNRLWAPARWLIFLKQKTRHLRRK